LLSRLLSALRPTRATGRRRKAVPGKLLALAPDKAAGCAACFALASRDRFRRRRAVRMIASLPLPLTLRRAALSLR